MEETYTLCRICSSLVKEWLIYGDTLFTVVYRVYTPVHPLSNITGNLHPHPSFNFNNNFCIFIRRVAFTLFLYARKSQESSQRRKHCYNIFWPKDSDKSYKWQIKKGPVIKICAKNNYRNQCMIPKLMRLAPPLWIINDTSPQFLLILRPQKKIIG